MHESKKTGHASVVPCLRYPIRLPEWPCRRKGDVERLPCQLQDVQPCAVTVDDVDKTAIVDFNVVRHVTVGIGVGVGFRHVERHFDRGLRLADVPNPYGYMTNNVEIDDRGFIYVVDRNGAGLDILQLTGKALDIAFPAARPQR